MHRSSVSYTVSLQMLQQYDAARYSAARKWDEWHLHAWAILSSRVLPALSFHHVDDFCLPSHVPHAAPTPVLQAPPPRRHARTPSPSLVPRESQWLSGLPPASSDLPPVSSDLPQRQELRSSARCFDTATRELRSATRELRCPGTAPWQPRSPPARPPWRRPWPAPRPGSPAGSAVRSRAWPSWP